MATKRVLQVSAALFLLAMSYHLGGGGAIAQDPSPELVAVTGDHLAFTNHGDIYERQGGSYNQWQYVGNVFGGFPTPTRGESWGSVKSRYQR